MKTTALILFSIFVFANSMFAQGVAIGTTTFSPADDAILELRSSNAGLLLPRMTVTEKNAIASPTESLLIYQTNGPKGFKYFDGSVWTEFGGGGGADNFGNHTAENNIILNDFWLTNDGDDEGIRIDNSGNVGVGTTAPSVALEVVDNNSTNGQLLVKPTSLFAQDAAITVRGARNNSTFNNSAQLRFENFDNDLGTANTLGMIAVKPTNATTNVGDLLLYNSSDGTTLTETMRLTKDGKVGIGTSSPTKELDVNGALRVRSLSGSGTEMVIVDNDGNLSTQEIPEAGASLWTEGVSGDIYRPSGKVGVGTATPSNDLDVNGGVRVRDLGGSGMKMVVTDGHGNLMKADIPPDPYAILNAATQAVSGASSQSTNSSSYNDVNQMSLSVEPGTYIAQFNCDMQVNNGNTVGEFSFLVDGSTVTGSIRKIKPGTNSPGIASLMTVITVNNAGSVKVQFRRNAGNGTVTVGGRTLMLIRLS